MGGSLKGNQKLRIVIDFEGPKTDREVERFNAELRKIIVKNKAKFVEKSWEPKGG